MALTRPKIWDIDTTISIFNDPITTLHQGSAQANVDVGFLFNRASGTVSNVALYWSESTNSFITAFTSNSGQDGSQYGNITVSSYANLTVGSLLTINGSAIQFASGAGIVLNGSYGTAGQVLTASGTGGLSWAPPGVFSGGVLPNQLVANSGAISTGINNGALVVGGGMGVSGNLYVGGNITSTSTAYTKISSGTSAQRPGTAALGMIRYNTDISSYEGYGAGASWSSLGGVKSVDGKAYISAEASAGAGDDVIRVYSGSSGTSTQVMWASVSNISILPTTTATSATTGALQVAGGAGVSENLYVGGNIVSLSTAYTKISSGTSAQRPGTAALGMIRYNTDISSYEGFGAGSAWSSLGGVKSVDGKAYISAESSAGAGDDVIRVYSGSAGTSTQVMWASAANVSVLPTTSATSTTTGALQVAGGAGIVGAVYAGSLFDSGNRVVSTSSGAGNLTISGAGVNLTVTGPGATTVGGSTSIPIITTDAYGRIVGLTSTAVSTTINTSGTTGTGSVSGGGTLTFTSTNGIVVAASGSTISISSPQNLQTTASPTFAGLTTNGATQVNSTLGVTGVASVTNSTVSSGVGNGALVVTGGVGVGATSYFGGDIWVTGNVYTPNIVATTTSTLSTSSPMVYFQANPYPYNFETGFYSHFIGGAANVYSHTGMVRNHNNNYWTFFSNVKSEPTSTTINFADTGILYDTIYAGGAIFANTTQSISVTSGALVVSGGAGINGNLNVNSAAYIGYNAANTPLVNPSIIATQSSQAVNAGQFYVQSALINNSGTGSADIVAYPNNTTDGSTGFMDLGFTGNLFADPAYTITKANDGYIFASALQGSGLGGNLIIATDKTGTYNDIVFATGSFYANAEVARFHGNVSNNGNLTLSYVTPSTSTTTGAFVVSGGVGISGNVFAGNVLTTGIFYPNGSPYLSGIKYTASNAAPSSPRVGDQWYYTTSDTLYEYISDSISSYWVDITGSTQSWLLSSNSASVSGNMVAGNVYITSNAISGTTTRVESNVPHPFMLMGA